MCLYNLNIIILIICITGISSQLELDDRFGGRDSKIGREPIDQLIRPGCPQREPSSEFEATCKQRLVCYFGSWSVYRAGDGRFSVEDIDPMKCTHLIYAFVGINEESEIQLLDVHNDLKSYNGQGAFSRFVKLKEINPNLRVLISVGGQNEESVKFSQAFRTSKRRQKFVQSAMKFLKDHGFDGLDLDWEYPTQKGGTPEDRENFSKLLKELRTEFDKCGYTLSAFVSPAAATVTESYNVETLVKNLDFISIGTYNIHGPWETKTGHNSPLYAAVEEIGTIDEEKNIDAAVKAWLNNGAPAHKLLIGVGLFGRSFTLSSTNCTNTGCGRRHAGEAGPYTADPGFLGYNEICPLLIQEDTDVVFHVEAKVPYLIKGNQWVSYDNERSLQYKVDYVLQHRLGGIMTWSVDTDDFKGTCQNGKFPLLTTLQKVVNCKSPENITSTESMSTTQPTSSTTTSATTEQTVTISQHDKKSPPTSYTIHVTALITSFIKRQRRSPIPIIKQRPTLSPEQTAASATEASVTTAAVVEEDVNNKSPENIDATDYKGCLLPEYPNGGKYTVLNNNKKLHPYDLVSVGTVLQYSCWNNYDLSQKHSICLSDSSWSESPTCNKKCQLPRSNTVDFICYNSTQHLMECTPQIPSGSVVRFKCKDFHKSANNLNYAMLCDGGSFDYSVPLCEPDCGLEPSETQALIIDGMFVKRGTFPWHVAVYELRGEPTPKYEQICGGTLIATHLIVSAAHCFYSPRLKRHNPEALYAVAIGKLYRDWDDAGDDSFYPVHKTKVRRITLHDTYKGSSLHHQSDIALLEMEEYVTFSNTLHPACVKLNDDILDKYHTRAGNIGKVWTQVAGWGLTAEAGDPSNKLRYLSVPVIGFNDCLEEMEKYNFQQALTNDKLCAGYLNGSAVCSGDSGGGLVFPERESYTGYTRWYLRGIVSVGPPSAAQLVTSCRRDSYTAYTRVNYFKEWISNNIIQNKA